jgi:putative DNA primase/helicase
MTEPTIDAVRSGHNGDHGAEPAQRRNGRPSRPLTDLGNAERLVAKHGDDLRFVPELGWHVWDGQRWRRDRDGEPVRRMAATVRAMKREEPLYASNEEILKAFRRHLTRSEQQPRIAAALKLAEANAAVIAALDTFDSDPWLLNVENGTLDLSDGSFREHRRNDLLTKLAPVLYDPEAAAPTWLAFHERIFAGDDELIAYVQRAFGYSLTGLTWEQVLFLCNGPGANGKTTMVNAVRRVIGDYAQQAPADTFLEKRGSSIPNDIARLPGARFVSALETNEGCRFDEALVKQATGGDTMTPRFLRCEYFEFRPVFKLWMGTNHLPEIRGTDEAIWRRIRLIPFTVTIPKAERDPRLEDKLADEASGILNWLLVGVRSWKDVGLDEPEAVKGATTGYRDEMDVLGSFIEERCTVESAATVGAGELYTVYGYWADANGEPKLSQKAFGLRLKERGLHPERTGGKRFWRGIGFKEGDDA